MKQITQKGIALIITLVMLSIVTLMAVAFLTISRSQRQSVRVDTDYTTARLMAEMALSRAQAEILSTALQTPNYLGYDMIVSTNFINSAGFDPSQPLGQPNPTNVNYDYVMNSRQPLNEQQRLQVIANLLYDPRAPVFVKTNENPDTPLDFRFFLDLNRNGLFETNGWGPIIGPDGTPVTIQTGDVTLILSNFFVGDPEWVGVLQNPHAFHSATNRFIGRYAYIVLPTGKSLDINYIHNNARLDRSPGQGYYRNQGVGSWEINLAAFFRDLNTNAWTTYYYQGPSPYVITPCMEEAFGFLTNRWNGYLNPPFSVANMLGVEAVRYVRANLIDDYTDGPHYNAINLNLQDDDNPTRPWSGSENLYKYTTINDLFDQNKTPYSWIGRLLSVSTLNASYDRYTFYRMLAQLGTDSAPANYGKININYDNRPFNTNKFQEWTPRDFVITVANRLFELLRQTNYINNSPVYLIGDTTVRPDFCATNIMLWPTNEYTPTIHRIFQFAINLYDATTNRTITSYPFLPSVLMPKFKVDTTGIYITNYVELTNSTFLNNIVLRDLNLPTDRAALASDINPIVYDVPLLIGAKKGLPNFNEFSMLNIVQISRKVELVKHSEVEPFPFQTNVMYLLSISNQFGIELWNAYSNSYPRPLRLQLVGDIRFGLTNNVGGRYSLLHSLRIPYARFELISQWPGKQFRLPIYTNIVFIPESLFIPLPPQLIPADSSTVYPRGLGFIVPEWYLVISNRFFVALVDQSTDRIVDFVAFNSMHANINITSALAGQSTESILDQVWATNRVGGHTIYHPTEGILTQLEISLGNVPVSDRIWRSYNRIGPGAYDKDKAIDLFREFCGLSPLKYTTPQLRAQLRAELRGVTAMQAPFAPIRKFVHEASWQANDPLVHYMVTDLMDPRARPDDPYRTNAIRYIVPATLILTNSNLGTINNRYRPWGGNPNQSYDPLAYEPAVKDPGVESADDWNFPGHKFPNIGWIGRVHRGTPWQTVYLKSAIIDTNSWYLWAGAIGTHPTNDWKIIEAFTTAISDHAARGLLSVNQTNVAAWSAILSGVSVFTNTTPFYSKEANRKVSYEEIFIQPNSPQLYTIIEGINRTRDYLSGITNEILKRTYGFRSRFARLGEILATPELTLRSPYINTNNLLTDEIVERIPQQILSLIKEDEPRFTIYAFGQALKEAPNSVYMGPGPFYQLCTNYQVVSEFGLKAVVRLIFDNNIPRLVIEDYQEIALDR